MSKCIILDPGHGLNIYGKYSRPLIDCRTKKAIIVPDSMGPNRHDNHSQFYREDFGTLLIAKRAKCYLEEKGHSVFLTREDEKNAQIYLSSLSDNEWKKNNWKSWRWIKNLTEIKEGDIFVSIHTNAGGGTGTSCFWDSAPNGPLLAEELTKELNQEFNLRVRRIDKHRYLILRNTCKGRAVLLECLFHDNFNDIQMLLTEEGIDRMGKAIANALNRFSLTF